MCARYTMATPAESVTVPAQASPGAASPPQAVTTNPAIPITNAP